MKTRRFVLIPFRSCEPLKYKIKSRPSLTSYSSCVKTTLHSSTNKGAGNGPMLINSLNVIDIVHYMSGRSNHVVTTDGIYPAPHPPLHFFNYIFRKHFEYQFNDKAFDFPSGGSVYKRFIRNRKIFTTLGEWDSLLISSQVPQNYVYQEIPHSDC